MAFACLFVPDFPVQSFARVEPELREKPVVVLAGAPPLMKIFAANARARTAGAEIGMTKTQVETMCSGITLRLRSLPLETTAHAALLDCAWTISPRVEDRGIDSRENVQDTAVLDLAGCEKLFGSLEKIASDLQRVAVEVGFQANIAISSNLEAAVCAARGFPGITIIPEGEESGFVGRLPLSSLNIPLNLLEVLDRWGVYTCGHFASLPETAVVERLGQEGRHWQLLARGVDLIPLLPKAPPIQFEERMELDSAVDLLDPLLFILNRLLAQLCSRLKMHVLVIGEIQMNLTLQKKDSRSRQTIIHFRALSLPVPNSDSSFLLKLLQLDLQSHPPSSPVLGVILIAIPAASRNAQLGLFLPASPEPGLLEITLARLRNTVGDDRVGSPILLDTHRPNAFRQSRFALPSPTTRSAIDQKPTIAALRIYRPPLPASVELTRGKPTHIKCDGATRQVLALAGPWRTKGNWWSDTIWARDDWDVLLLALSPKYQPVPINAEEETALYRIYKDLRSRLWFIEGIYD